MNNQFRDMPAVEFIRDALQREDGSRAAVMVGAGFSRNAVPASPSAKPMPTWSDMAKCLCRILYADATEDSKTAALNSANSTSGFLRLAQEYCAVFGRTALNEQIRMLVPDMEYEGGRLHHRLLSLPWTDVLTTNWDTLLERSSKNIYERNYDVVRVRSEIPTARRPRIVKLHGSFPAHEPFIFTEDDYRTYPLIHAPFVNLVQQSLMESVLCLLGFSGDDPNFLHWAGWVRDNLGENAPKIYLVGWLSLSSSKRRLLEERNVIPIDLSTLPMATSWASNEQHSHATEWFLSTIGMCKSFTPNAWPLHRKIQRTFPAYLGTIPSPPETVPDEELTMPKGRQEVDVTELASLVKVWIRNRSLYPGWFVAPLSVRRRLWRNTQNWITNFIDAKSKIAPTQYLAYLEELIWRIDTSLAPVYSNLITVAIEVLEYFDFELKVVRNQDLTFEPPKNWPNFINTWAKVALAVARDARQVGQFEKASTWIAKLELLSLRDRSMLDEIFFEKLLALRDQGKLTELSLKLEQWHLADSDPVCFFRKAGLHAELGSKVDARECIHAGLRLVRRFIRRGEVDHASNSRESLLLWMEDALQQDNWLESPNGDDVARTKRRKEIIDSGSDVNDDFYSLVSEMERSAARMIKNESPNFYRRRANNQQYFNGLPEHVYNAFQVAYLGDRTGIPNHIDSVALLATGSRAAAALISKFESWMSLTLQFRAGYNSSSDNVDYWTRQRIALMPSDEVVLHIAAIKGEIEFALQSSDEQYSVVWARRLQFLLEVFTRMSIRFDDAELESELRFAISLISVVRVKRDIRLHSGLSNLIASLLQSLDRDQSKKFALSIFSLPLDLSRHFRDPILSWPIAHNFTKETSPREVGWTTIISEMLKTLVEKRGTPDFVATVTRLLILYENGLLTSDESNNFSKIIWSDDSLEFPDSKIHAWAYFKMPCANSKKRNEAFRYRFLTSVPEEHNLGSLLKEVGEVYWSCSDRYKLLRKQDIRFLEKVVAQWFIRPTPVENQEFGASFRTSEIEDDIEALLGLRRLILLLTFSKDDLSYLLDKLASLYLRTPQTVLQVLPALLAFDNSLAAHVEGTILQALVSDDEIFCIAACHGICRWLETMRDSDVPKVSTEVVRELGRTISRVRKQAIGPALDLMTWILNDCPEAVANQILDEQLWRDVEVGLAKLSIQATYTGGFAEQQNIDISLIRRKCVILAKCISTKYPDPGELYTNWLAVGRNDVMREVRQAC